MAIYHLEAKIISRGAGRSAVAASAYLSCSNILNDYDGVRHDNTRKKGLVWRKAWAEVTNRYLQQYGHDARIDHRSHAERGLDEQPTIHEGVVARALEKKGITELPARAKALENSCAPFRRIV